jgi:ketosteroid isomerase-like protein
MSIIDAVNRWYAAWNAHDISAIADAIAPTGTYIDPTLDSPIDNQATAQHGVSNLFKVYPMPISKSSPSARRPRPPQPPSGA